MVALLLVPQRKLRGEVLERIPFISVFCRAVTKKGLMGDVGWFPRRLFQAIFFLGIMQQGLV